MRFEFRTKIKYVLIALCLQIGLAQTQFTFTQEPAPQAKPKAKIGAKRGFIPMRMDSRAQTRTYHFKETNEDLEYCLFVSSKVSKDKKAPLIVTLHGLGAGPQIMLTKEAVDLAEEGGYILLGPMGYNVRGWYGIPMNLPPDLAKMKPKKADPTAKAEPHLL